MSTEREQHRTELVWALIFVAALSALYLLIINWAAIRHHLAHLW